MKPKLRDFTETESVDYICNGKQFDTLDKARAYKKRKNSQYQTSRYHITKRTHRMMHFVSEQPIR